MNLKFKEDVFSIKAGTEIAVEPNQVNYWVGENGSGKTVASSAIMTKVGATHSQWMAALQPDTLTKIEMTGFEVITQVSFSSAKMRQVQFVDLDAVFSMAGGISRLKASEGQNAIADLCAAVQQKDDPNHLFIFDELDGHLDVKHKVIFFDRVLPKIKGTTIVVSHDLFFISNVKEVFDFTDKTTKSGGEYINQGLQLTQPPSSKP